MSDAVFDMTQFPAHLGLGVRVVKLEHFDGTMEWYQRYGEAHAADVTGPCTCIFITAGQGTEHRPR